MKNPNQQLSHTAKRQTPNNKTFDDDTFGQTIETPEQVARVVIKRARLRLPTGFSQSMRLARASLVKLEIFCNTVVGKVIEAIVGLLTLAI
jgi:hypothetical protein